MRVVLNHWALLTAVGLVSAKAEAQSRAERIYVATTVIGNATIKETGEKTHVVSSEIALSTPPARLGSSLLFGTLSGRRTWISNGDFRDNGQLITNDLNLGAILVTRFGDRWSFTVGPQLGIRSTFEAPFGWKDLVYSAIAIGGYAAGEERRLRLSFGLVATNTTSFSPVIPIGGLEYRGVVWRIEATYPQPAVFYSVHPRVELGLGMKFDYPSYRIKETQQGDKIADFVRTSTHYGHFTVGTHVFGDFWLTAKAGITFGRVIRELDHDRNNINSTRLSVGVAPYGGLVLAYRRSEAAPADTIGR